MISQYTYREIHYNVEQIKGSIEPTHGSACSDVRKLQSMDVLKLSNSLELLLNRINYPGDKENPSNF